MARGSTSGLPPTSSVTPQPSVCGTDVRQARHEIRPFGLQKITLRLQVLLGPQHLLQLQLRGEAQIPLACLQRLDLALHGHAITAGSGVVAGRLLGGLLPQGTGLAECGFLRGHSCIELRRTHFTFVRSRLRRVPCHFQLVPLLRQSLGSLVPRTHGGLQLTDRGLELSPSCGHLLNRLLRHHELRRQRFALLLQRYHLARRRRQPALLFLPLLLELQTGLGRRGLQSVDLLLQCFHTAFAGSLNPVKLLLCFVCGGSRFFHLSLLLLQPLRSGPCLLLRGTHSLLQVRHGPLRGRQLGSELLDVLLQGHFLIPELLLQLGISPRRLLLVVRGHLQRFAAFHFFRQDHGALLPVVLTQHRDALPALGAGYYLLAQCSNFAEQIGLGCLTRSHSIPLERDSLQLLRGSTQLRLQGLTAGSALVGLELGLPQHLSQCADLLCVVLHRLSSHSLKLGLQCCVVLRQCHRIRVCRRL
mmetsp:Transcript_1688/g.4001  ORF Transcript_1688/g.4001 Transcript_1688/m.4001 type:complete len:473 (-) Transcript_1688:805-2223(-)